MEEELFIPKTKHKGLKIFLAILLIAGLAVGGYFLYQYKFNNPKVIINKILDTAKANINEVLNKVDENKKYHINGHIKMDANISEAAPIMDILKNIEVQFDGEADFKENIANFTLSSKYKNDKLIDIKTYYDKESIYLLLDDIYDKYLKFEAKEIIEESSIDLSTKDIKTLYNGLIDALQTEINKREIKKADAKITIDEKQVDVIDNYIELKDKEVNEFVKGFATTLRDNKEFTDTFSKIMDDDGKTLLDNLIKNIDEDEYKGVYKISFYTDKGLFNKKLMSIRQNISQDGFNVSINVDMIDDEEVLITTSSEGVAMMVRLQANDSKLNITASEIVNNEKVSIEVNMNYEKIKDVTRPDVSNSKNIEKLTEKENMEISNKLAENKNLQKLIEELRKVLTKGVEA